ncbi:DUF2147 domain-containing protein [Desulfobotulus sp. H1]|uniref:DUF2147 domain-containing protein n=1 Tax=Desulfobotulus pelophilus TaxID=2823377 RepID=A0ABT3N5R7_9BACT|nr:DUF2147 domain-containing protein [Desulfobotulus pelophilus]MCW7752803.1 DUF2147 domain-containing protein [Desulfobotulus pelophilus]
MAKPTLSLIAFIMCMIPLPFTAMASSAPTGLWQTEGKKSVVEVIALPESKSWAAHIVWLDKKQKEPSEKLLDTLNPDPMKRKNPVMGLTIAWGFKTSEDGTWKDGQVYDPETGKMYKAQARMRGDRLELRGYIGLPAFGRSTSWKRIPQLPGPYE